MAEPRHEDAPVEPGLVEELRAVGRAVDVPPPPPDLAATVLARLAGAPPPRRTPGRRLGGLAARLSGGRRALVVVVVAALVAVGAATPAAARIAHWLGLGGVVVVEDPGTPLPPGSPQAADTAAPPGSVEVPLADARTRVPFPIGVPAALGDPDRVFVSTGPAADAVVSMQWLARGVRMDQFAGRTEPVFVKRYGAEAEFLTVGDGYGFWLAGPHPLEYLDPGGNRQVLQVRTAGPSLVWQRAGTTLRLEGLPTSEQAVALAESVR
jgi:hypothetical protein